MTAVGGPVDHVEDQEQDRHGHQEEPIDVDVVVPTEALHGEGPREPGEGHGPADPGAVAAVIVGRGGSSFVMVVKDLGSTSRRGVQLGSGLKSDRNCVNQSYSCCVSFLSVSPSHQ